MVVPASGRRQRSRLLRSPGGAGHPPAAQAARAAPLRRRREPTRRGEQGGSLRSETRGPLRSRRGPQVPPHHEPDPGRHRQPGLRAGGGGPFRSEPQCLRDLLRREAAFLRGREERLQVRRHALHVLQQLLQPQRLLLAAHRPAAAARRLRGGRFGPHRRSGRHLHPGGGQDHGAHLRRLHHRHPRRRHGRGDGPLPSRRWRSGGVPDRGATDQLLRGAGEEGVPRWGHHRRGHRDLGVQADRGPRGGCSTPRPRRGGGHRLEPHLAWTGVLLDGEHPLHQRGRVAGGPRADPAIQRPLLPAPGQGGGARRALRRGLRPQRHGSERLRPLHPGGEGQRRHPPVGAHGQHPEPRLRKQRSRLPGQGGLPLGEREHRRELHHAHEIVPEHLRHHRRGGGTELRRGPHPGFPSGLLRHGVPELLEPADLLDPRRAGARRSSHPWRSRGEAHWIRLRALPGFHRRQGPGGLRRPDPGLAGDRRRYTVFHVRPRCGPEARLQHLRPALAHLRLRRERGSVT